MNVNEMCIRDRAMMDELVIKQAEKFKEDLKEENIKQIRKIDEINTKQTESLENKLELQSEKFRQDTIRITESLEELKIDNIEIKQMCIRDREYTVITQ